MTPQTASKLTLLLLVFFITALFAAMIREFLLAILMAGIVSAMLHPLYLRFVWLYRGRKSLASLSTLLVLFFGGLLPLAGLIGLITAQAIKVGRAVKPWVEEQLAGGEGLRGMLTELPFYESIRPYRDEILTKAGEIVGQLSSLFVNSLSSITLSTVNALFMSFILFYSMFFFLIDGEQLVRVLLYYLPMREQDERRLLEKFTSVTRATLKGTALVGLIQGALGGIAFAVVGIEGALFWATIMAILSIIPGLGPPIVWVPAAIYLALGGHYLAAAGLTAFSALVVGGIDNLLRPRFVGKDTQMHELFILFGTLGGLLMFGIAGVIIGPILAALMVTLWEMYGYTFRDTLPGVIPGPAPELNLRPKPEPELAAGPEAASPDAPAPDPDPEK